MRGDFWRRGGQECFEHARDGGKRHLGGEVSVGHAAVTVLCRSRCAVASVSPAVRLMALRGRMVVTVVVMLVERIVKQHVRHWGNVEAQHPERTSESGECRLTSHRRQFSTFRP